mmetsp:Transcript_83/g.300  ORF Transcript_83/g.300 Transcript_83/m.300 type:complete len:261 (-) Transcript_83:476-1258(-)
MCPFLVLRLGFVRVVLESYTSPGAVQQRPVGCLILRNFEQLPRLSQLTRRNRRLRTNVSGLQLLSEGHDHPCQPDWHPLLGPRVYERAQVGHWHLGLLRLLALGGIAVQRREKEALDLRQRCHRCWRTPWDCRAKAFRLGEVQLAEGGLVLSCSKPAALLSLPPPQLSHRLPQCICTSEASCAKCPQGALYGVATPPVGAGQVLRGEGPQSGHPNLPVHFIAKGVYQNLTSGNLAARFSSQGHIPYLSDRLLHHASGWHL